MAGAKISFRTGQGGLPMVRVETESSTAEVYLQGAHVTHFQRHEEKPILFLSREAVFAPSKSIRGGVPVILPWFGQREGKSAHGYARFQKWDLLEVGLSGDDVARLRFRLPETPESAEWPRFVAEFEILVGYTLEMELKVTNVDETRDLPLESCLHTYFAVSDIVNTDVGGLRGVKYLDALDGFRVKTETEAAIKFAGEVDRVYFNSPETVEIVDHGWGRVIEVAKSDSLSTVVWNPWIEKSKRLTDYGDDEYLRMVCVESGNVKQNQMLLKPGQAATLGVAIDSREL
jgi:glucose-6-phosphate 1-epimerase